MIIDKKNTLEKKITDDIKKNKIEIMDSLIVYPEILEVLKNNNIVHDFIFNVNEVNNIAKINVKIKDLLNQNKKLADDLKLLRRSIEGGVLNPNSFPSDKELDEIRLFFKWIDDTKVVDLLHVHNNLNSNSIVFDVGSYVGDWAKKIIENYNPIIYTFEPVLEFYQQTSEKIKMSNTSKAFHFGLGDKTYSTNIHLSNDSSSLYGNTEQTESVLIKDIYEVCLENDINHIDLMKINIEGGEYGLLFRILEKNINVDALVIQFHGRKLLPDAELKKEQITTMLLKMGYKQEWCYDWIWEKWIKK